MNDTKNAPDQRPNDDRDAAVTGETGQNKQPSDLFALPWPPEYVEILRAHGGINVEPWDGWVRCKVEGTQGRDSRELIVRDGMALRVVMIGPNCRRGDLFYHGPLGKPYVDPIEADIQAKGLTAPRITPADVEANIVSEYYFTADDGVVGKYANRLALESLATHPDDLPKRHKHLGLLTFCVLMLRNGFTVTGESACASPENFDAEIGRKIARQDALEKVWGYMGYALKSRLAGVAG